MVFKELSRCAKSFQAVKDDACREMSMGFGNLEISRDFELVVSLEGWGQKAGVRRLKSTQGSEFMFLKPTLWLQTHSQP